VSPEAPRVNHFITPPPPPPQYSPRHLAGQSAYYGLKNGLFKVPTLQGKHLDEHLQAGVGMGFPPPSSAL